MPIRPRVPAALLTILAVYGCNLGTPTGTKAGPVSYQTKVKKVEGMTKTFSLTGNQSLGQVATSLRDLGLALQSAFASGSAATSTQVPGAMSAAGTRAMYTLSGVMQQGNAKLTYDEATKELTGVSSPDAELAFKFENKGRTRSWHVTIVRSKDGTTGSFDIEVTGGWTSQPTGGTPFGAPPTTALKPVKPYCPPVTPEPYPAYSTDPWPSADPNYYSPEPSYYPSPRASYYPSTKPAYYPSPQPSYYPSPSPLVTPTPTPRPSGNFALQQVLDGGNYPNNQLCYAPEPDYEPEPEWTPPPPPPYKLFGGEYPNVVEAVSIKLDVKPRGDAKLAIKMEGRFDEPEAYPGMGFLVPTHWVYKASVPKVAIDWESRLHIDPGKSSFKGGGSLTADTPDGSEKFLYDLSFDEAAKTGAFGLTNVAGKVRLQVVGSMASSTPDASLISTEDGKHLGKVTFDPARPRFAKVLLDDGNKFDWELLPENLLPAPPQAAPPPDFEE